MFFLLYNGLQTIKDYCKDKVSDYDCLLENTKSFINQTNSPLNYVGRIQFTISKGYDRLHQTVLLPIPEVYEVYTIGKSLRNSFNTGGREFFAKWMPEF